VKAEEHNSVVLEPDGNLISYRQAIEQLIENAKKEVLIISPYVTTDILGDNKRLDELDAPVVRMVVCPGEKHEESARYVFTGQVNPDILLKYYDRGFEIRKNCALHSKIVFSDGKAAVVGSANLSSAAFERNRWETGVLVSENSPQRGSLYRYAQRLAKRSKLVRKREIKRWIELLEKHKAKIAKMRKASNELDEQLKDKVEQERYKAKGKGEALMLFASADQIDSALAQRRGFVGLIKIASQYYKFPDCDYHLDILLDEMGKVPVWLYARGQKEVIASGHIIYADYGRIDTLVRSFSHRGYKGVGKKIVPIDAQITDLTELDKRKIHVLIIVKRLEKLPKPIKVDQLKELGFRNPNTGPGGRYVPIRTFRNLTMRAHHSY